MKLFASHLVLTALAIYGAQAPLGAEGAQIRLSDFSAYPVREDGLFSKIAAAVERVGEALLNDDQAQTQGQDRLFKERRVFVEQHGQAYELLSHSALADHRLRVTKPTLCDPNVKQYSGYLDITDGKHLFFWFFEARNSPETAPLLMYLNGGPGCSSMIGVLFENGPCHVFDESLNATNNPYSWTTAANMIFLDQPINTGYSYSDDGSTVKNSAVAAVDVYAFLQLFLTGFKEYASAPFHLAATSYGGTYLPHFASEIYRRNKVLDSDPSSGLVRINLESVIIGNGYTNPLIQLPTIPTFACEGPYPVFEGAQCKSMQGQASICERMMKSCYQYNTKLVCLPAILYCGSQLYEPVRKLGINPYDVRKTCGKDDGPLCYKETLYLEDWMNLEEVQQALGTDPQADFITCNGKINDDFMKEGDATHNAALLLTDLVNDGIRLLVYAGNADYMCNFIGNEAWVLDLDTIFKVELNAVAAQPWVTLKGEIAGMVRSAGEGAGNVTYVTVFEAGHMMPFDQPENGLDLITRWMQNAPL